MNSEKVSVLIKRKIRRAVDSAKDGSRNDIQDIYAQSNFFPLSEIHNVGICISITLNRYLS